MEILTAAIKFFLTRLNGNGAEYLLVGGYAVRYYGFLRETRDLDLWVPAGRPDNAAKIVEALGELCAEIPPTTFAALQHPNRIIQILLPPARIDILDPILNQRPAVLESFTAPRAVQLELLTVQSGLDFQQAYAKRTTGVLDGISISIASLENIKMIKQAGNRPKDLLDLEQLPE